MGAYLIRLSPELLHRIATISVGFRPYNYSDPTKLRTVCRIPRRDMGKIESCANSRRKVINV